MSDGCWVQFWDQVNFTGPTLRIDGDGPVLFVEDMDVYIQSDGSKEGDEPDSLKTGSRAWLIIYEKKGYKGKQALFGPNSEVPDLHDFNTMRGEASSFKLYDYAPPGFTSLVTGAPAVIESSDSSIGAQTVNVILRTVVGTAIDSIPVVGGVINSLISGLWPDDAHTDQVWASAQNYLNQVVAGAYWQSTYDSLNADLASLYNAAHAYATAADDSFKKSRFENLYNLVNNLEPHFIHDQTPESRYTFMVPYVTLRLAVLLENITHYEFYFGDSPEAEAEKAQQSAALNEAIDRYRGLLELARTRIVKARRELIRTDEIQGEHAVVDDYNGYRLCAPSHDQQRTLNFYADTVQYQLELKLDIHNAIGQLWEYFRPGAREASASNPVPPPTLTYRTGPYGAYNEGAEFFDSGNGVLKEIALWSGTYIDALQLTYDNTTGEPYGGKGGAKSALTLDPNEVIDSVSGTTQGMITEHGAQIPVYSPVPTKPIYENQHAFYPCYRPDFIHSIAFASTAGRSLAGGTRDQTSFDNTPMPGTANTRLTGLLGYKSMPADTGIELLSALIFKWQCDLPFRQDDTSG